MSNEFGLPRFSDFIIGLVEPALQNAASADVAGERQQLTVASLSVDLPFELDMVTQADNRVVLNAAPPTQRTQTSVMPVFHQVRVTICCDDQFGSEQEQDDGR